MRARDTRRFMALCSIAQHFGRPGAPTDQAWIESLWGHIKREHPHLTRITDPRVLATELERIRVHYNTVRLEVEAGIVPSERLRVPGGGDRPLTDKQPGLLEALDELVHPETRGSPTSLLRWTSKSSKNLAQDLVRQGFEVSSRTVLRLLHQLGYSLQANAKVTEGRQHGSPWVWWRLVLLVSKRLFDAPFGMIDVLELCGRDIVAVAVDPLVVVPVNPCQGGELYVFDGLPWSLVWVADQLGLVEAVHAFSESVVEGLSG